MSKESIEAIEEVMLSEDVLVESEMWDELKQEQTAHTANALESLRMWHA